MKSTNKVILLFIFLCICLYGREIASFPKWINDFIIDTQLEHSTSVKTDNDYSDILLFKNEFIGYIGNDYQKLDVVFADAKQISGKKYKIKGYTVTKNNKCDFEGVLEILDERIIKEQKFGVDDHMKGKIKEQGYSIAKYEFIENAKQSASGIFKGYAIFRWYIDKNGDLKYDDIEEDADSYSNNQFSGVWISNKTSIEKKCAWGHYRIANSKDLDIGAGEFSVNPKYKNNGWD